MSSRQQKGSRKKSAKAPTKLWDRGVALDAQIERFTAGRDPELDLALVPFDALASMAHATMLAQIDVLSREELAPLKRELRQIVDDARRGDFTIGASEEDGHTAIERRLTAKLGATGKRIHSGRSRNDQVIAALRLFGREMVLIFAAELLGVVELLLAAAEQQCKVVLPGYSHTRQAMPTTVGHWLVAHAEGLLDSMPWLATAFAHLNRSPLGSASGFGVALPLDRPLVAELLGFDRVQENTLAVQNDRGKTEYLVLGALLGPLNDLSRLASDVIWYSSDELGFLHLSAATTTGSSIMPQKRNPDLWELVRATAGQLRGWHTAIGAVYGSLSSGYHRDLQLTKEPFVAGLQRAIDAMVVVQPALRGVTVDAARCRAALVRATGATDAVYARVRAGEAFREVYREIATDPQRAAKTDPSTSWRERTHLGAPGALKLGPYRQQLTKARRWVRGRQQAVAAVWQRLLDL